MTDTTIPAASTAISTPAAPANEAEARAHRAELEADPEFVKKYRNSSVGERRQMDFLNDFISKQKPEARLDAVMAGTHKSGFFETTTREHPLTSSQLASVVDELRKDGFSDTIVKEIIEGAPVTAARHAEAEALRDRLIKDREWGRRYRANEHEYVWQMRRINAVLAAPIIETK